MQPAFPFWEAGGSAQRRQPASLFFHRGANAPTKPNDGARDRTAPRPGAPPSTGFLATSSLPSQAPEIRPTRAARHLLPSLLAAQPDSQPGTPHPGTVFSAGHIMCQLPTTQSSAAGGTPGAGPVSYGRVDAASADGLSTKLPPLRLPQPPPQPPSQPPPQPPPQPPQPLEVCRGTSDRHESFPSLCDYYVITT